MYDADSHNDSDSREFFRCAIDKAQSAATLKIGWKTVAGCVQEKSIDGYSILLKRRHAKTLRAGKLFRMKYDGTTLVVKVKRITDAEDGHLLIGVTLAKDLTKPPRVKSSWWPSLRPSQKGGDGSAQIAFAGFVLVLFCTMAMPGLGDRLGTAKRIQSAFQWVIVTANAEINAIVK